MKLYVFTLILTALSWPVLAGSVVVSKAYTRVLAKPSAGTPLGVFATIQNNSTQDDTLVKVTSQTGEAEIHTMDIDAEGIMQMREISSLPIPAQKSVPLKPGGLHIMLFDITPMPKPGDTLQLSFTFKKAGTIQVPVAVRKLR